MTTATGATDSVQLRPREVVWCPPGDDPRDVVIRAASHTRVGMLAEQLCGEDRDLVIDGAVVARDTQLGDLVLRRGASIGLTGTSSPGAPPVLELVVVGGLLAGTRYPLPAGVYRVGRSVDNDVVLPSATVSAHHAVLTITLAGEATLVDLQSTNGSRVDGPFIDGPAPVAVDAVVQIGAIQLTLQPPAVRRAHLGEITADGTRSFNRPPRCSAAPPPAAVPLPPAPRDPAPRARLAWAAMLAPLLFGVGMAVLYDPRFAAFALFSPAMMFGTWLEDRRRARREAKTGSAEVALMVSELRQRLTDTADVECRRRRVLHPDPGTLARWLATPDVRLWERRRSHDDAGVVSVGLGRIDWTPPTAAPAEVADEVREVLAEFNALDDVPVPVVLDSGRTVGICGPREPAAAVLRSLVLQAVALHGPADLRVAILTDDAAAWDWAKWLPHTGAADTGCTVAVTPDRCEQLLGELANTESDATTLLVVDGQGLTEGPQAPARPLLGRDRVAALVYAPAVQRLPAACATVVELHGEDGRASCFDPAGGRRVEEVLAAGVPVDVARRTALAAAALDDPEVVAAGGRLPDRVSLLELLEMGEPEGGLVRERWARPSLAVPVGVGEDGPVLLDLAQDGPHGLIAGTTGAGKSELLRTLVVGLAATASPQDLTFVLIDYKGGSAFDDCAALPHTVGVVTDLDEQLGQRALRCLEAELRHRERQLRNAGAADLDAYRSQLAAGSAGPPLPRLVVVVDEFAALAAELPDFMDRLVSVAQRGRSLGVHLLLATQRPAGAVSDHIRANMNLRIALRVQDSADSLDVIGSPAAANLTRHLPGRAYLRRGPGELACFQTALVTAATAATSPPVEVASFAPGRDTTAASPPTAASDLSLLVTAVRAAFDDSGVALPRRPWPDPLPAAVSLDEVAGLSDQPVIGLLDEPDQQRSGPLVFDPAEGSMLLYGAAGSGPAAALVAIALGLTGRGAECYVVDAGSQVLAPLADLPHVGAVIRGGERERCERLVRHLSEELGRRRAQRAAGDVNRHRPIVVLLDNYAAFAAALDDLKGLSVLDTFARIVADGPSLGLSVVITADRANAVPVATAATVATRLVFRMADRLEYSAFGIAPGDVGELPPNRGVVVGSGSQVHIAEPNGPLPQVVAPLAGEAKTATKIGVLPTTVALTEVLDAATFDDEWFLPLGIGDDRLVPEGFRLGAGDSALVTGPARSGKSTVLCGIAATVAKHRPDVLIVGVAPRRSPLRDVLERVVTTASDAAGPDIDEHHGPVLLLVDDADTCEDADGSLAALLTQRRDNLHVIAAGRADVLRTAYGHWTTEVRRSRQGLALRPNIDLDGDLWHTPLPRGQRGPYPPGRGFLVCDGRAELLQAALL